MSPSLDDSLHGNVELEIDLLRCFTAVTSAGSFTAAAALIGLSQSAASLRIKRLEERLGGSLLVRDARSLNLTAFGAQFLPDAIELLNTHDRILARHTLGRLSAPQVGIAATIPGALLPALFSAFEQLDLPRPTFRMLPTLEAAEAVQEDNMELGLVWSSHACPWGGHMIREARVIWVAHEDLDIEDLDVVPVVSHTQATYPTDCLRRARTTYATVFESSDLHACERAVESGLGVAAVPDLSLRWLKHCDRLSDPRLLEATVWLRLIVAPKAEFPSKELAAALKSEIDTLIEDQPSNEATQLGGEPDTHRE